jgi:hypothetical protein
MRTEKMLRHCALVLACGAFIAVTGCEDDPAQPTSKARTINGASKTVGGGTGTSWLKLDDAGNPASVGITLTENALSGLSAQMSEEAFALPAEASATGYNHISLDWNPTGHAPMGMYDTSHFDVHFYMISSAERDQIIPTDTTKANKMPGSDYAPAGYVPPPVIETVPRMGVHWVDPMSGEFHGHAFDKTMIYGFWNGNMIFTEPMITLDYLKSKPNFTENLKLPTKYPKSNSYYATSYSVKYNADKKEYTISLDGLTKR